VRRKWGVGGASRCTHLAHDLHRLPLQAVLLHEGLRAHDGGAGPVRGGRALQLGERLVHHRGVGDLVDGVDVLELRVGVVLRVAVVLLADHGEVLRRGAVPAASAARGGGRVSVCWKQAEGGGKRAEGGGEKAEGGGEKAKGGGSVSHLVLTSPCARAPRCRTSAAWAAPSSSTRTSAS
jgi:hypothetical protein